MRDGRSRMLLACAWMVASSTLAQTTVRAPAQREDDVAVQASDVIAPEQAVNSVPGLVLASDGGPLSPSRVLVRGLAGPRVGVSLWGRSLLSPLDGNVDATSLPWMLQSVVHTGADTDGMAGRMTFGGGLASRVAVVSSSFQTLRAVAALHHEQPGWTIDMAADGGFSAGDFSYQPSSSVAGVAPGPSTPRTNNDQRRGMWVGQLQHALGGTGGWSTAVALRGMARIHDGGVPGFALAPLVPWRARTTGGLTGAELSLNNHNDTQHYRVGVNIDALQRRSWLDESAASAVTAWRTTADLVAKWRTTLLQLDALVAAAHTQVDVTSLQRVRVRTEPAVEVGVQTRAPMLLLMHARVRVAAATDQNAGGVVGMGSVSLSGRGSVRPFVRASMGARNPTIDELHAPAGVVRGNNQLTAERTQDVEGGVRMQNRGTDAAITGFVSSLQAPIVYVQQNAYDIMPLNLRSATRAGAELRLQQSARLPLGWSLRGTTAATWLWTQQGDVRAPLPFAPMWTTATQLQLAHDNVWSVAGFVRARSSSSANRFGTLRAAAYALFGVEARAPCGRHCSLFARIDNLLDVQHARDTNMLPLPGRSWSLGIEVQP
jgi:outer membrane receptor protein involved in Fe transport